MLHDFLSSNRDELIRRCRSKVSKRDAPPVTPTELEHGVPLFLEQLVWALRCEQENPGPDRDRIFGPLQKSPAAAESSRTAALHGKQLLDDGYSVEQMVHRRVSHLQPSARQRHRRRRCLVWATP